MILVDESIKKAVDSGEIELSDFSEKCLQPASYDLRVGEEGFMLSAGRVINIQSKEPHSRAVGHLNQRSNSN